MKNEKLTIKVLIEGDRLFTDEYLPNQKIQVIINKTLANLGITSDDRELRRADGTPITDYTLTIEEVGILDGETLKYFKKAPKPPRDKGFASEFSGWHENASLKNFYESEMAVLKSGLNQQFHLIDFLPFSETNNRVVVRGILNYDIDKQTVIQIFFPTGYPYIPPRIIPLTADPLVNLETQPLNVRLFQKGNQYSDGSMCLLPKDTWNMVEHGIGWALYRAQEWLKYANSKGGFPKDKIVDEAPSQLPHQGQVLFPKAPVHPKAKNGNLILTQFKPNHYILEDNVLSTSVFKYNAGKEIFKWYRFPIGITMKSLFLEGLNPQGFINIMGKYFSENIVESMQNQRIAFFLPSDIQQWHFFKIDLQKNNNSVNVSIQYLIVRIVDKELFLRTKDIFDSSFLKKKKVVVIGLGAIGSEAALKLAQNGIGNFELFDSDTFEIGNSVRHAADIFYIGETKVDVTKQLILRSNPNATVNAHRLDVLDDNINLPTALENADICLVLTGEEQVDYFINRNYFSHFKIPFLFARVSKGGLSGSIQIVKNDSFCLDCLSLAGTDQLPSPKKSIEFKELPPEFASCSSPALPGSGIDVNEVALQVARISLQLLLPENEMYPKVLGNHYLWHGPFGSANGRPFEWEINFVNKHPNCQTCGSTNNS